MKENSIVDWRAFGVLLKAARLSAGFSRGQALCDAIKEKTGLDVSERTIYALEDASRSPSADIFLALQQVLPQLRDPAYIKPAFKQSNIEVAIVKL